MRIILGALFVMLTASMNAQIVNLPCQTEVDAVEGLDRKAFAGIGNTVNHSEGSLHNFSLPSNTFGACNLLVTFKYKLQR